MRIGRILIQRFFVASVVFLAVVFFSPVSTAQSPPLIEPDLDAFEVAVVASLREAQAAVANALASGADDDELATVYGELGMRYLAHHLGYAAQPAFENAAALAPQDVRWPYLTAYSLHDRGEFNAALLWYDKTLAVDSSLIAAQLRRAEVLFELGGIDDAEAAYRALLESRERNAVTLAGLGHIAMRNQQYQTAVDFYAAAIQSSPQSNQLRYPLSRALARLDRNDEAKEQLALAGQIAPQIDDPILADMNRRSRSTQIYLERGIALMAAGREQEAIVELREAVSLNPDDHFALATLGQALLVAGQKHEAQSVLENAIENGSELAATYFNLGTIFESAGNQSGADELYIKAISADSGYLEARLLLANSLMRNAQFDEALLHYRVLGEREPNRPLYFYRLAILEQSLGNCAEAMEAIERATELAPSDGNVMQVRSRTWSVCPQASEEQRKHSLEIARLLNQARPGIDMLETEALASAANGQFEDAHQLESDAIVQALSRGEHDRAAEMQETIQFFNEGRVPDRAYNDHEPLLNPAPIR